MATLDVDLDALVDRGRVDVDVPDQGAFLPWKLRILAAEEFAALSPEPERLTATQLAYLAWFHLLGPSTHNTVPARYRLRPAENVLSIWLDRKSVLSASDRDGRQAAVGVGCGVTNTVLAAGAFGWDVRVAVDGTSTTETGPHLPGEPRYVPLVHLHFHPRGTRDDPGWLPAILQRKVVRAEFRQGVVLDAELQSQLAERVKKLHPGLTLHLITDAPTQFFLGKFQELADATVLNREEFALELGGWFLENDDQRAVGMRGREFGLSDESARHMHRGLLQLDRLYPDEMAWFAKAGNIGMRSASAVAVITVAADDLEHRIAAGRAYEEMVLHLLRAGFCTAMHAALTEVDAPNLALRGRLRTHHRPTVVFRIGKPLHEEDGRRPHAARPPLRDVLLPEGSEDIRL